MRWTWVQLLQNTLDVLSGSWTFEAQLDLEKGGIAKDSDDCGGALAATTSSFHGVHGIHSIHGIRAR